MSLSEKWTFLLFYAVIIPSLVEGCCNVCFMCPSCCEEEEELKEVALPTATVYPPGIDYCEFENSVEEPVKHIPKRTVPPVKKDEEYCEEENPKQVQTSPTEGKHHSNKANDHTGHRGKRMKRKKIRTPTGAGAKVDYFEYGDTSGNSIAPDSKNLVKDGDDDGDDGDNDGPGDDDDDDDASSMMRSPLAAFNVRGRRAKKMKKLEEVEEASEEI
ncbi:nucleolin-like [Armigeres subalbatus]|uniref:nucleolin-like n=1 Tax=Armigeres subalbatus TaxID=124917 RepID=UPI002ED213CC